MTFKPTKLSKQPDITFRKLYEDSCDLRFFVIETKITG